MIIDRLIQNRFINSRYSIIGPIFLGLALRLYNSTAIALWHDEGLSTMLIPLSWGEMLYRIGLDVQAPLYYILLKLWQIPFGYDLFSLRSLSILFGVGAIFAGYLFTKEVFKNHRLALVAALFIAINPFQIEHSIQVRMYSMGVFMVLISSYFLTRAINRNKSWDWVWYALASAASLYTHYYLGFSIIAQGIFILWWMMRDRKIVWGGLLSLTASAVLFIPWLGVFISQLRRSGDGWMDPLTIWSVPATIFRVLFGGFSMDTHGLFIVTNILVILAITWFLVRNKNRLALLIPLSLVLPYLLSLILSFKEVIFLDRYLIFASVFLDILIASAIFLIPRRSIRYILVSLFIFISLFFFFNNWEESEIYKKPGMAGAANEINKSVRESDRIYVDSSLVYLNFQYYNRTNIYPLLYAPKGMAGIPYYYGTAVLRESDLITDLSQIKKGETVWLISTNGYNLQRPAMPVNWVKIQETPYQDTPDFKGHIFVVKYLVK